MASTTLTFRIPSILILLFCSILKLTACAQKEANASISITRIPAFKETDTSLNDDKMLIYKNELFLVTNFVDDSMSVKALDSFVARTRETDIGHYTQYKMIFYKESSETNMKNIAENRRILDRYSQQHDMIYAYEWWKGDTFFLKKKFVNGDWINPPQKGQATIEDVPTK